MNEHERAKTELEVTTLRMFGVFFAVLAAFVLVGTLWALDKRSTAVISIASGIALFGVAGISRFAASRIARKLNSPTPRDSA
jgi:hypothetical protein